MTKSLTEKWKDGELEEGYYYIRWSFYCDDEPSYMIDFFDTENFTGGAFINKKRKFIDEVICHVPSYDEYNELKTKCHQLEKELDIYKRAIERTDRIEKCLNQEGQIKKLQEQLKEANEALKYFAESTIGHKQKDGTYGMWFCSGEVAWNNPLERIKSRMNYVCYDPRPAKKYLKKWGIK